ncbi:MAG: response regulator [Bacteroidales bacterium]|nr:response regulator [Bacteroidales bacterium]
MNKQKEAILFKSILGVIDEAVSFVTADFIYAYVNHAYSGLFQKEPEQLIGQPISNTLGKKTFEGAVKPYIENCLQGESMDFQYSIPHEQDKRYFTVSMYPYSPGNSVEGVIEIIREVPPKEQSTNTYDMERRLRESERKLNTLMGNLPGMAYRCAISRKYTMEFVSEGAKALTGYLPEDIINDNKTAYGDLIHPADREYVWNTVQQKITEGRHFKLVYRIIDIHKQEKWVWEQGLKVERPGGGFCLEGFITDITEQKKYEQELMIARHKAEESDRLKSAFLANMSHEIRTPINAIVGFAEMLRSPDADEHEKPEYTDIIRNNSLDLLNLINDLLEISKIEAGQVSINKEACIINAVIDEIIIPYREKLKTKYPGKVEIKVKKGLPDNAVVYTDSRRMKQVLINLLDNAVKFTSEGYIALRYHVKKDNLIFEVEDTGIGIEAGKQHLVFERFWQLQESTGRKFGGAGLGLSISKTLVELLGGKIWVKSQENHKTCFCFTLPYEPGEPIEIKKAHALSASHKNFQDKTILIIEDDESSMGLLCTILAKTGVQLLKAGNGMEGFKIFKNNKIDLMLMDIRLPDISGYRLIKSVKEAKPDVPVIAQTAYAQPGDRDKCYKCGFDAYLSKPLFKEELLEIIEHFIKPKHKDQAELP